MTDVEERLRRDLRQAAERIDPASVRPLRAPRRRRLPGLVRWLAPVTAMAAVIGVIFATSVVAGGPAGHTPPDTRPARTDGAQGNAVSGQDARQLASLAGAVTTLVASTEDEQDDAATYVADGRPAASAPKLIYQGQQSVTTLEATRFVSLARRTGQGLPPQAHTALNAALKQVAELPALRDQVVQTQTPALSVIQQYSLAISTLLTFDDQIASGSGDAVFVRDVNALSLLQRAEDAAAQERAILDAALARGQFQDGEQDELSAANLQERNVLILFDTEATSAQVHLYNSAVAGPQVNSATQMLAQALAIPPGGALRVTKPPAPAFFTVQKTWHEYMTFTLSKMRAVEQNLLTAISARSQALHWQAQRTILETWLKLAVVVLAVMALLVGVTRRRRTSRLAVR